MYDELVKGPNRVAAATNACNNYIQKLPSGLLHLHLYFMSDDLLIVMDDGWDGVRTKTGSDEYPLMSSNQTRRARPK
ncbi:hypothetical protein PISMIDRAFT_13464 [Pisolithus microcarpus 441]|uniref:Uncharacterized protein n=1 Tax=Pisolithus microcarpus 441 TaxID=765257 RepID=A0A0C9YSP0_9AGAM|nr:hypothetical protein PISMIDRAFT_13464 [Pisolithus microcarpus 441]